MKLIAKASKPRGYTWQVPVNLDQGNQGACVGFSWAQELAARPKSVKGITNEYAKDVYWQAQREDEWDGGSFEGASPFYEGTSVLAGAKVIKARGFMDEYRWAFGLDELILAVGYAGPAVLGVLWYSEMFDADADGYIHVAGTIAGGHAILCNAVSVKKQAFHLWNSWGASWGVNGGAWISFADMDRLLGESGEACIPIGRRAGTI